MQLPRPLNAQNSTTAHNHRIALHSSPPPSRHLATTAAASATTTRHRHDRHNCAERAAKRHACEVRRRRSTSSACRPESKKQLQRHVCCLWGKVGPLLHAKRPQESRATGSAGRQLPRMPNNWAGAPRWRLALSAYQAYSLYNTPARVCRG